VAAAYTPDSAWRNRDEFIAEADRRIFGPRPEPEHGEAFPIR
jgi:nuclear transport factor 2 (NTF2) superfamily protein